MCAHGHICGLPPSMTSLRGQRLKPYAKPALHLDLPSLVQ